MSDPYARDHAKRMKTEDLRSELKETRRCIKSSLSCKDAAYNSLNSHKSQKTCIQSNINTTLENKKKAEENINSTKAQIEALQKQIDSLIAKKRDRNTPLTEKESISNQIGSLITKNKELKAYLKRCIDTRKECVALLKTLFNQKTSLTQNIKNDIANIRCYKNSISYEVSQRNAYKDELKTRPKPVKYTYNYIYDSSSDDAYGKNNDDDWHPYYDPYAEGYYDGLYDDYDGS